MTETLKYLKQIKESYEREVKDYNKQILQLEKEVEVKSEFICVLENAILFQEYEAKEDK